MVCCLAALGRLVRLESTPERSFAYTAPRANWKGFLRLSMVTCPVALYPAISESEEPRKGR
ncbi:hypothetical protein SAMN05216525_10150 [Bradyrhizobium sp. Gha]|nr:hypothetical protein SAMN05216525_10150 [Bradyrhizobium sp. Gha]